MRRQATVCIKNDPLVGREIGYFLQAAFASRDNTYPEAKVLALNLMDHIFESASERCLSPFIDDVFIAEWLIESVRNGGAFSALALKSLERHFFTHDSFMKREFAIGESSFTIGIYIR